MSQVKLSSYYGTRKRRTDKLGKEINTAIKLNSHEESSKFTDGQGIKAPYKQTELDHGTTKGKPEKSLSASQTEKLAEPSKLGLKARVPSKSKIPKPKRITKKVAKETSNVKSGDIRKSFQPKADESVAKDSETNDNETILNSTYTIIDETQEVGETDVVRTPKRNRPSPDEELVDSKKKKKAESSVSNVMTDPASIISEAADAVTPSTHSELMKRHSARKNLFSDYKSESLAKKDSQNNLQHTVMGTKPKQPPISSEKIQNLKECLTKFDKTFQKLQQYKTNKCKITSVITSDADSKPGTAEPEEEKPVPCYIKHQSLIAPSATLALPYKYKLLCDSFRCSDTVMSMLNNRKEVCTFDKLKNGIQDMTKRNFTRTNLGQIKTVFPAAYKYHIEKNSASVMNRKPGTQLYELVISPNAILPVKGAKESITPKRSSADVAVKSNAFQPMTPACLIDRKNVFTSNLITVVKKHHQNFLEKLDPPVYVPMDKLTKWHPKFPIESIADIEASELPEPPNKSKVSTALDVLNKIRGSAGERIEKALQSVVDKNAENESKKSIPENKAPVTSKLLKNISADLLQRIRARESAKIVEDMTKDPKDKKRKEMMGRLPEIIRILRTYFITERRAAISLDDATQKVMDSYHSTLSAEDIRQHLQLIADTFPKWLSLIPIRKGLFLKIDKNKDINQLLDNIPA